VSDEKAVPGESFAIGLCGPEHRAEQARLFAACFKKGASAEDLAWRYDRGPHGRALSAVARPPGGEAVSGYACSPRRALSLGDEATLAPVGETGDVMTHPDWRKRGIFSGLDRRCMAEAAALGWPLCFGLPNRRSAHIFLQLGWEEIGRVRPYTCYLRADAAAREVALREGRLRALALSWSAARSRAVRARLARARAGFEVRPLERFPPETLLLSRAVERRFAFMVRRDPAYLDWRFLDNPAGLHAALGLYAQGALAGLAIVQRPRAGEAVGYLVDVLAPEEPALAAALSAGLELLEQAGASAVQATAIDGSWWRDALVGAGFARPRGANHLSVILHVNAPSHPLAAAARDASRWYFTDGDRDDATMG
jgi:hypothetical protein